MTMAERIEQEAIEKTIEKTKIETAIKMLKFNSNINFFSKVTEQKIAYYHTFFVNDRKEE